MKYNVSCCACRYFLKHFFLFDIIIYIRSDRFRNSTGLGFKPAEEGVACSCRCRQRNRGCVAVGVACYICSFRNNSVVSVKRYSVCFRIAYIILRCKYSIVDYICCFGIGTPVPKHIRIVFFVRSLRRVCIRLSRFFTNLNILLVYNCAIYIRKRRLKLCFRARYKLRYRNIVKSARITPVRC